MSALDRLPGPAQMPTYSPLRSYGLKTLLDLSPTLKKDMVSSRVLNKVMVDMHKWIRTLGFDRYNALLNEQRNNHLNLNVLIR